MTISVNMYTTNYDRSEKDTEMFDDLFDEKSARRENFKKKQYHTNKHFSKRW
jgi:hypothetical protein